MVQALRNHKYNVKFARAIQILVLGNLIATSKLSATVCVGAAQPVNHLACLAKPPKSLRAATGPT